LLHQILSGWWIAPMAVLSAIGGGWGSLSVLPMIASPRTRGVGRALAVVLAITAVLVFVLKQAIGRVRPCTCLPDVHAKVFAAPMDFSFPSGHAAGSMAFAVFLAIVLLKRTPAMASVRERLARRSAAAILLMLAFGVGLSRIALGVHFPGDVLAGAVLGATLAAVGASMYLAALRRALPPKTATQPPPRGMSNG
jgi:undecaprenyl-diphosphatase